MVKGEINYVIIIYSLLCHEVNQPEGGTVVILRYSVCLFINSLGVFLLAGWLQDSFSRTYLVLIIE